MRSDLLYLTRTLSRDRGFALAVILSLALGIGANTVIFSLVNAVLLRPLPYAAPERLVSVHEIAPKVAKQYPKLPVNIAHYLDWVREARSFEQIALFETHSLTLTGAGEPEQLKAARMTANTLSMLGIRPRLGRDFREAENDAGHDRVVLLSDSVWRRRFRADPTVVGRKVVLDGQPYDVVGVLPPAFRLPTPRDLVTTTFGDVTPEIFKPFGWTAEKKTAYAGEMNYNAIGRLREGVSAPQALAELNIVQAAVTKRMEGVFEVRAGIEPLGEALVGRVRTGMLLVMGAVGAVLLILCVNLANLSIARAVGRSRDWAIRTALGASAKRLAAQSVAESLLLAGVGGALGTALAYAGLGTLIRLAPAEIPRLDEVSVDLRVLIFALALSVLAGLSFGLAPVLRTFVSEPQEALKSGSHTASEGVRGVRVRNLLVAFEVGLSAVFLIAAGLLMSSFLRLMNVERGFEVERVLSAEVSVPATQYKEKQARLEFVRRVVEKASTIPGVTAASAVSALPLSGERWVDVIGYENDPRPFLDRLIVNVRFITPGYFRTLGVQLKAGRVFHEGDRERRLVLLSEGAAKKLYPGQDPLGRKIDRGENKTYEIAGIVPDLRITTLDKAPVPIIYLPVWDQPPTSHALLVRTSGDPKTVAGALRQAVWSVDPRVPVPEMKTLVKVMDDSLAQRRFQMMLVLVFAVAALALASLGIYGVVSYSVARRRPEIAVRMALGARTADVNRLVLRQGLMPVVFGLAAGTGLALAFGRVLRSLLFEVTPGDPATMAAVAASLLSVAAAACAIPALRASRVEPMSALRSE